MKTETKQGVRGQSVELDMCETLRAVAVAGRWKFEVIGSGQRNQQKSCVPTHVQILNDKR